MANEVGPAAIGGVAVQSEMMRLGKLVGEKWAPPQVAWVGEGGPPYTMWATADMDIALLGKDQAAIMAEDFTSVEYPVGTSEPVVQTFRKMTPEWLAYLRAKCKGKHNRRCEVFRIILYDLMPDVARTNVEVPSGYEEPKEQRLPERTVGADELWPELLGVRKEDGDGAHTPHREA